jgi:C-terminal processing protease CtpA/Prc
VQWTALLVRHPDKSRFFTLGVNPDIPVTKTLEDFIQGRDPELEKALELIRTAN